MSGTCECCDSAGEHEAYLTREGAYWSAYFGDSVKRANESARFWREEGVSEEEIEQRLRR